MYFRRSAKETYSVHHFSIRKGEFERRHGDQLPGLDQIEVKPDEDVQLLGALELPHDNFGNSPARTAFSAFLATSFRRRSVSAPA
jgi:hypothetical protein